MSNYSESLGNVFQALADPTRRAVIQRLGAGPASTKELAKPFKMALPSFMQHLTALENSGLIASKKEGRVRTWQVNPQQIDALESWILEQRALWEGRTDRFVAYVEDWYERESKLAENNIEFTVSRYIKAPRHVVWKAWTIPEHLARWWCPAPLTCRVLRLDLRPGGAFDIVIRDPGGNEMAQTGAFLEIAAQERIIFTTALTNEWRPAASPLPITAVISMADDNGGTRYETRVLYKDEEERQKLAQMHFEAGWSAAIDQLGEFVKQIR
jgi:uncharacterized protein YndB with AHSA1/START domain/DNA-binding transcriptional ArsR family regulator